MTMPSLELSWLATGAFLVLIFGSMAAVPLLEPVFGNWSWLSLFGWFLIYPLMRFSVGRLPSYCHDVGSLARAMAGLNYRSLSREFGAHNKADVWNALVEVVRDFTGLSEPFDRQTTFFAKS